MIILPFNTLFQTDVALSLMILLQAKLVVFAPKQK